MKQRYLGLLAVCLAVALALTLWGRTAARRTSVDEAPESTRVHPVELVLMIGPDGTIRFGRRGMPPPEEVLAAAPAAL